MSTSAQATLSFILLIGGVIIEIAVAGSFITYFLSTSGIGERLSARAFAAATAGVEDVTLKLTRDKEFAAFGPVSWSIAVGADSADIAVSRSTADPVSYVYTATSTGVAANRNRRLTATVVVDRTTGLTQVRSVVERPF